MIHDWYDGKYYYKTLTGIPGSGLTGGQINHAQMPGIIYITITVIGCFNLTPLVFISFSFSFSLLLFVGVSWFFFSRLTTCLVSRGY